MPIPLIPIVAGAAGVAAGTALHSWLTQSPDAWHDKSVFNNRMKEMHGLALALNSGFSTQPRFMKDTAQLQAWRTTRDSFGKFYADTGTLVYSSPTDAQVDQAKSYASKFYFWESEYRKLTASPSGNTTGGLTPSPNGPDLYNPAPSAPSFASQTDWAGIVKWSAIGIGGAFLLKTLSDLFATRRA